MPDQSRFLEAYLSSAKFGGDVQALNRAARAANLQLQREKAKAKAREQKFMSKCSETLELLDTLLGKK